MVRQIEAPGQFYPFIQGNIFEYEFLVDKVTVPDYISSTTEPPNFSAPSGPIEVAGEKTAVETVVLQIREKLAKMEGEGYTTRGVELGPSEGNLLTFNDAQIPKEVFAETGCAVFTTPKADRAILFGPSSDLLASMMVLYNKVMGYKIVSLDLAKALTTAPKVSHAIDVVRYVQTTGKGELIENELDITLVFPNLEALHDLEVLHNLEFLHDLKEPCLIITIGKSQESVKAASKRVEDLLTAYTPNCITRFKVEPLNIKHIHGKDTLGAQRITDATSVELLFPKDPEDEEITLIYGGESKADEEIKEALEKAKAEINEVLKGHPEIVKKVLDVPQEFHEKLNGSNGAIIRALIPAGVAVQFGAPKVRAGRAASAVPAGAENTITLRGPPTSVTTTATDIRAFLAANKDRDFAETITESFLYPKLFSGNLIGAKGSNLTKLRDQYAVDIKLGEGKGEIKGVKVCVDAARRNLQAQIKELEDKAVLSIRIPKAFHSGIVGQGGATIRRLEERYSVRINIPNADDENTHQAPDEIIIRGRKLGAEQARQEIIELYEYEAENSHEAKLKIKASAVTFVFKNSNNDIKHICDVVGARVRLPRYDEPTDKDGNVPIIITGTKEAVAQAKATMTKIIKLAEDTTSETIYVDKRFHRTLIGTGGSALNKIVLESGATEDRASLARLVHFPAQGENSDEIKVTGPAAVVKKIVAAINAIVAGLASQVSTTIQVAPEKHRKLIGAQGIIRRDLETKHGVTIDIPRQRPGTPQTNADIKITGPPAAVEEAKNHILGMVKETEGETLEVPRRLHSAIAEGTFFKYLQKNFGVTIEHHGARPKRPEDPKPTGGNNLPTITDEDDGDRVSWEIVENAASGEEGTYPWIIRGKADGIAKAKKEILAALATAEKQSYTGFLILPDPGKYRFVVGPNGSTVDRIRRETGCKITVPRAGGAEAITLHGDKEGLEKAKTKILEVVRNQQQPKGKRSSE